MERVYFNIDILSPEQKDKLIYFDQWLRIDGNWAEKGLPLYAIKIGNVESNSTKTILAESSGIMEQKIIHGDLIKNETLICNIHPLGSYNKENKESNSTYYFYLDKYKYLNKKHYILAGELGIKDWFKQDGEYVKKGDKIVSFYKYDVIYKGGAIYAHNAEKSGYLDINISDWNKSSIWQNTLVYAIHDKDEDRINRKFVNVPDIKVDDFTNNKTISINGISSKSIDGNITFIFKFINENGKDYIVFNFFAKEIMLSKDNIVSFLFEDSTIIDFKLTDQSYKIINASPMKCFENKMLITDDELKHFEFNKFKKWKLKIMKNNIEIIGGDIGVYPYQSYSNLKIVINKFAKEFRELVRMEIPDYNPLINRLETNIQPLELNIEECCYVYLMVDTINKYHKIGISNNPEWREKTLQSEKPTIELIASKIFIKRKIAASFEKALHDTYSDKRIRGEWFQLNESDINEIRITLND